MSQGKPLLLATLLALLVFTGCASSPPLRVLPLGQEDHAEKRLVALRIERWGEVRFSGLLAMQIGEARLQYALLDASGVKLLEARADAVGETQVLHAKGALREAGLATFLGEALARIFVQEPQERPCTGDWWHRLCRESVRLKTGHLGPLPLWRADFSDHPTGPRTITYLQPWLGVRLVLRPVAAE